MSAYVWCLATMDLLEVYACWLFFSVLCCNNVVVKPWIIMSTRTWLGTGNVLLRIVGFQYSILRRWANSAAA